MILTIYTTRPMNRMVYFMRKECPHKNNVKQGDKPWKCDYCGIQNGDAPPESLACLRCRDVARMMEGCEGNCEECPSNGE